MRIRLPALLAVIPMVATLTPPGKSAEMAESPFGIPESAYSLLGVRDAPYPFTGRNGCFPVGNGTIFAHLGVDDDFNTLHGITGPGYQTHAASGRAEYWSSEPWTPITFTLVRRGQNLDDELWEPVKIHSQSIMPIRGAAVVRTIQRADTLTLNGLTYAVPQGTTIVREFELVGTDDLSDYALQVQTEVDTLDGCLTSSQGQLVMSGENLLWISPRTALVLPQEDAGIAKFLWQVAAREDIPENQAGPDGYATSQRELTLAHWRDWSSKTKSFDSGDPLLDDLMTQVPVVIETQRDKKSGGVSPMVSYHGNWVRDNIGPILTYLQSGRLGEVRRMLEFHRKACWKLGFCHMLVPLDTDISGVIEGDWSTVGVEHAEVPSLIVLQHYWYWKSAHEAGTPDDDFLREAWPFLLRNLTAMPVDETHGVHFHGDETYTQGALYSTFDRPESGAIGYPNGYISTDLYSLDNTLLHRAAASALSEMGLQLFRDAAADERHFADISFAMELVTKLDGIIAKYKQDSHYAPASSPVTGQYWPWPFSNISLGMYLPDCAFGALDYTGNYQWVMDQLWRDHSIPGTTPRSNYHTGHNLGAYLLAATDRCDHELAQELATLLVQESLPDGAWCEVYDGAGAAVPIYGRINRVRPWESGINYFALSQYLSLRDSLASSYDISASVASAGATAPSGTRLLVVTRDGSYRNLIRNDYRLSELSNQKVCAWDIGWPLCADDFQRALLTDQGELRIPFLYLDRGTKLSDRRTFKTDAFWDGPGMQALLARFRDKGGIVLEEADLRPAWSLSVNFRSNEKGLPPIDAPFDPGMEVCVTGDDGPYTIAIKYDEPHSTVIKLLASEGLLMAPDWRTTLRLSSCKGLWIPLDAKTWEALQCMTGSFSVRSAGEMRSEQTFVHTVPPAFTPAQRIYQATLDKLPAWIPQAKRMTPFTDGSTMEWDATPGIDLSPSNGHAFSGSFPQDSNFRTRLWFAYDDLHLYIAGEVIGAAMQAGEIWSADRLSLVFDARLDATRAQYPQGAVGSEQWRADDYWVFLAPFATTPGSQPKPITMRIGGSSKRLEGEWNEEQVAFYGEIDSAKASVKRNDSQGAYTFEWSIPLSELPFLEPEGTSCCGLTVFYTSAGQTLHEMMHLTNWRAPEGGISWRFWDCGLLYFAP